MNNLRNFAEQKQDVTFSYSLAGFAAKAAAKVLMENWETAIAEGCDHQLVNDMSRSASCLNTNASQDAELNMSSFHLNRSSNLVNDIEDVIEELKQFRVAAWEALPLKNGGLGGYDADDLITRLDEIDVYTYEAEDLPYFGFTGCDADEYTTETEALIAAVVANAEQLGMEI